MSNALVAAQSDLLQLFGSSKPKKLLSCVLTIDRTVDNTGGILINGTLLGAKLSSIQRVMVCPPSLSNVKFRFDYSANRLYTYFSNQVITGESVTATAGVCTALAHKPTHVISVQATVNAAATVYYPVPTAQTLAAGQCHINYSTGVITLYYDGSHNPTSVTVDYLNNDLISSSAADQALLGANVTVPLFIYGY